MELTQAIRSRRSIRAFKPEPVPEKVLREIVELSLEAPSWANTQPWEFAIVGGGKVEEIERAYAEQINSKVARNPALPAPRDFPEPYGTRRRIFMQQVVDLREVGKEFGNQNSRRGLSARFFAAPNVIYIYVDRSFLFAGGELNVWSVFDCGAVAQTLMLSSWERGLGTVILTGMSSYPDMLRKMLALPDSKLIVLSIAIGYPDWDDPLSQLHTVREPVDKIAKCYGFS